MLNGEHIVQPGFSTQQAERGTRESFGFAIEQVFNAVNENRVPVPSMEEGSLDCTAHFLAMSPSAPPVRSSRRHMRHTLLANHNGGTVDRRFVELKCRLSTARSDRKLNFQLSW